MDYALHDVSGLISGILLGLALILLPGLGLVRLLEKTRFAPDYPGGDTAGGAGWSRLAWGLILAFALLPAIDALLVRAAGLTSMILLHGILAFFALAGWRSWRFPTVGSLTALPIALWLAIVLFDSVDFPLGGSLNQSLLYIDLVKHAATTNAIVRDGLPFSDPFFARVGGTGYYYYFYLWPAAIRWASGLFIDARMAFAAALFWAGLALPAALWCVGRQAGLVGAERSRIFLGLIALFCFTSGLDLLMMAVRFAATGQVEAQTDWWNSAVGFAVYSALGVPHHLTAMIAAWTALLLLSRSQDRSGFPAILYALCAGLAITTCFGSSVWIMVTIAPIFVGWGLRSLWRRDMRLVIAGAAAAIVSAAQLADLAHYRADSSLFPIALTVRPFTLLFPDHGAWTLFHLAALPLNYGMEFGIFAWGTIAYWRRTGVRDAPDNRVHRLLIASAGCSLLIATFLKSTIINNDLGWRSIWFAQFAAILWTAAVVQGPEQRLRDQALGVKLMLALGLAAVAWDVVGLRLIRPPYVNTSYGDLIASRPDDDDQRRVYEWATDHVRPDAVIQHNPALHRRMFDFGLYGTHRTGVADREAALFGASGREVADRIATLRPLFEHPLLASDMRRRADLAGVDYLLFSAADPVWPHIKSASPTLMCIYRQPLACLVRVKDLQP